MCEVTAKRDLLNYAIIQDIPLDVSQVIEVAILSNKEAKINLGHPFLIYGLCKKARVPLTSDEAWIHPIKPIVVKKNKSGVPRLKGMYDSGHEPLDEEEARDYQAMEKRKDEEKREVGQSSTQPSPLASHEEEDSIPPQPIEDQVPDLTMRFDAFLDESQEYQVFMTKEKEELKRKMYTVLSNQETIKQQLAQLISYHTPSPPP